jgi:N-acetylglucosaminyldiphosphoundecaprenol N-acetyl-beta-D-mannosaminyltransferase
MTCKLFGIGIEEWTYDELHKTIADSISENKQGVEIFNVNVHGMNLCFSDAEFYEILSSCAHVFCDGEGVRYFANRAGGRIPYRITYADWMPVFFSWLEKTEYSVFFLGAKPEVIRAAVEKSKEKFPGLKIAGFIDGYVSHDEMVKAVSLVNPDIVITGMGMPMQEKWVRRVRSILPVHVWLSGGAVFDYLSGSVSRAPRWMCDHGLEWLYRFLLEPGRMFSRYIFGNPLFVLRYAMNLKPAGTQNKK